MRKSIRVNEKHILFVNCKYMYINLAFWGDWEPWSPCPVDCSNQILVRYRACVKPSGSCGTPPAENISCKRLGCYCKYSFTLIID